MTETKISKKATDEELALAVTARDAFDTYGGIDGDPREEGLTELRCLQVDLIRWEVHNFSTQPPWTTTLGIFEELGELVEAIGEAQDEEVIDAIGDFMVYSVNLCTKMRLDFYNIMAHADNLLGSRTGMDTLIEIWKNVGKLSHVILKSEQKIRGYEDKAVTRRDACIVIARLVSAVTELAFTNDISTEATLLGVAKEVMQRDWIKYPLTGLCTYPTCSLNGKSYQYIQGTHATEFLRDTERLIVLIPENEVVDLVKALCEGTPTAWGRVEDLRATGPTLVEEDVVAVLTTGVEVERNGVPSLSIVDSPNTGRWCDGNGVTHYEVDGKEVSEEMFESRRCH